MMIYLLLKYQVPGTMHHHEHMSLIVHLFQDRDSRSNTFCGHTFSGDKWSCFWPAVKEYDNQNNQ